MTRFIINPDDFTTLPELIRRIEYCLRNSVGFSLVRIGDAENQIMSQGIIYSEEDIKKLWWANNEQWTGITLPNYEARNRLLESVLKADVVGVLHQNDSYMWRPLTEDIFNHCKIKPKQICYAFINVYFADYPEFIQLMQKYRLLLIGKPAAQFARLLKHRFNVNTAGIVEISNYNQITRVLNDITRIEFDIALISAGANAVILAPILAEQGKVALDFGRAMNPVYWENK